MGGGEEGWEVSPCCWQRSPLAPNALLELVNLL